MRASVLIPLLTAAVTWLPSCGGDEVLTLHGSGATFPAPIYTRWFQAYRRQDPSIRITYESSGSGSGIQAFKAEQVDFGASDAAMSDEDMAEVERGVLLLPMTAGAVVLAYNLPGLDDLQLSRDAYAGIFLGKIEKWNDPAIVQANPGVELPDLDITVVRRDGESPATYVLTRHLSAISEEWREGPGTGKSVDWPVGIGHPGNDKVAATIRRTRGAIGYTEPAYARSAKLPVAHLENKSGRFVAPTHEAARAALASITLPASLRAWGPDPDGMDSYPIVTFTWILAYEEYDDAAKAEALKRVLAWALTDGQELAPELGYVALPQSVVSKVIEAVDRIR